MLEKLISYIFNKHARKLQNHTNIERKFVKYTNAKTILILFESDFMEENIEIHNIIKALKADGKKVMAWGYLEKKQVNTPILIDFRILNKQNLDLSRKPKEQFINEITNLKFDLLIDLTVNEIIPLQYIALYSNASLKTGLKKNKTPIYDFMIEIDKSRNDTIATQPVLNASYVYNQIIFYLKSIQTKD